MEGFIVYISQIHFICTDNTLFAGGEMMNYNRQLYKQYIKVILHHEFKRMFAINQIIPRTP